MVAIHDIMGAHILQVHALLLEELQGFVHILQAVDAHLALGGPWLRNNSGLVGMKGRHGHTRGGRDLYQLMPPALPFIFPRIPGSTVAPDTLQFFTLIHLFSLSCLWVFCLYICQCTICMQRPQSPEEGTRNPGTGVIGCPPSTGN